MRWGNALWLLLKESVPHEDTVFRLFRHKFTVSPRTNSLTFSSENIFHHKCYLHTTNILLNPNPVYFFNWTMILQFSGCFLWSLNWSSFEKSYIFLLLEHHTFLKATCLLLSKSVTLAYSFVDFSMKTPWKDHTYCVS